MPAMVRSQGSRRHWANRLADWIGRLAQRVRRIAPSEETSASGEAPAGAAGGPPADWLEKVRQGAPHLLTSMQRRPAGSRTPEPPVAANHGRRAPLEAPPTELAPPPERRPVRPARHVPALEFDQPLREEGGKPQPRAEDRQAQDTEPRTREKRFFRHSKAPAPAAQVTTETPRPPASPTTPPATSPVAEPVRWQVPSSPSAPRVDFSKHGALPAAAAGTPPRTWAKTPTRDPGSPPRFASEPPRAASKTPLAPEPAVQAAPTRASRANKIEKVERTATPPRTAAEAFPVPRATQAFPPASPPAAPPRAGQAPRQTSEPETDTHWAPVAPGKTWAEFDRHRPGSPALAIEPSPDLWPDLPEASPPIPQALCTESDAAERQEGRRWNE